VWSCLIVFVPMALFIGFRLATTDEERQLIDAQASEAVSIELAHRKLRNERRRPGGLP
jgi:hypothetical protein